MAENIIPEPNDTNQWLEDLSTNLSEELLKLQGVYSEEDKELFHKIVRKYDDRIFEKFKIKNEENDFVINQLDGLKDKYREEKAKMPLEKMDNPMKYMEKFQDFSKPPILPPEANNQEYYRPNPAVYQRKLNANPYVVDVGLSKVDNPVYANFPKLDTIDVRANSRFYNMETNQDTNFRIFNEVKRMKLTGKLDKNIIADLNKAPTQEEFFNHVTEDNYDKINEIFMHPGFDGRNPQKLPEKPSYPIFDETGKLVRPGDRGGQYNPLKKANELRDLEFDQARLYKQIQNNEIIRYNIEKLGGLETTLDKMKDTLMKNEMKSLQRNLGKPDVKQRRRMSQQRQRKGHPFIDKESIMGSISRANNDIGMSSVASRFGRKASAPSFPHGSFQGGAVKPKGFNRATLERLNKGFSIKGLEVENTVRRNRRGGYRQPPLPPK